MSGTSASSTRTGNAEGFDVITLIVITGMTAVLFAGGLALVEFYEIPPDIDFKPFFLVYAVIALLPWGAPTLASAVGATAAEAILDVIEGAAADDPFGWVGYLVGFTVFGWMVKDDTSNYVKVAVAAVVGGFLQIAIEAANVLVISNEAVSVYGTIVAGNTLTHGVVMGAFLLVPTLELLEGRVNRMFGAAAQKQQSA